MTSYGLMNGVDPATAAQYAAPTYPYGPYIQPVVPRQTITTPQPQQGQDSGGGINLPNAPTGIFNNSGISGALNNIGTGLGFSSGLPVYSGIGPGALPWLQPGMVANPTVAATGALPTSASVGSLGTTSTLAGTLGAAGLGAAGGGLLANAVGLNPTGGSVGGGLGAGVGFAVGGPVGGLLGGLGGSVLGGMFGNNEPSNRLQVSGIDLTGNQIDYEGSKNFSQSGDKYSEQNAGIRDTFQESAKAFGDFLRANGATWNGGNETLVMRFGDRSGYDFFFEDRDAGSKEELIKGHEEGFGRSGIQGYERDANSMSRGLADAIMSKYNIPDELKQQLQGVGVLDFLPQAQGASPQMQRVPMVMGRQVTYGQEPQSFRDFYNEYRSNQQPAA